MTEQGSTRQIEWASCPVCSSSHVVRLPDDWQDGAIRIVGCGNPWHYATRSLADAPDRTARAEEIAAGIAELGAGGAPAFVRGYNVGFDDAWEQRDPSRPVGQEPT